MKKILAACALACALTLVSGCSSGPSRLSRSFDDWHNQKYTENAWVHGALFGTIIPAYPLFSYVLTAGDWLFVNPYYFWVKDAFNENQGTGYIHEQPTGDKNVTDWKD